MFSNTRSPLPNVVNYVPKILLSYSLKMALERKPKRLAFVMF